MTSEIVQSLSRPKVESGNSVAGQWRTEVAVPSRSEGAGSFQQTYNDMVASRPTAAPVAIRPLSARPSGAAAIEKTHKAFEAAALQTFISTMIPNESGKFSAGSAGKMWKSVLAEKIANRITESGGFRLIPPSAFARTLAAKHAAPLPPGATGSAVALAGPGPWQTSLTTVSASVGTPSPDAGPSSKE